MNGYHVVGGHGISNAMATTRTGKAVNVAFSLRSGSDTRISAVPGPMMGGHFPELMGPCRSRTVGSEGGVRNASRSQMQNLNVWVFILYGITSTRYATGREIRSPCSWTNGNMQKRPRAG